MEKLLLLIILMVYRMKTIKYKTQRHFLSIGDLVELKNGARVFITEYGSNEFDDALYGIGILKINTDLAGYQDTDFKLIAHVEG